MIHDYAEFLGPESRWYPGLKSGALRINEGANRVVDAATNKFVARFVPGSALQRRLAQLPLDANSLTTAIGQSPDLARLAPVLKSIQLLSGVGAVASVANLGVSCIGFALVLHRLSRIEGKLDEALSKLEVLQKKVELIHGHQQALSLARIRSAAESLDRALAADSHATRRELAGRARELFQESKFLYRELWQQVDPWNQSELPVATAMELQGRIVACAIGELQAEFISGDLGAFRQAVRSASVLVRDELGVTAAEALTKRSDGACHAGIERLNGFTAELPVTAGQLRLAATSSRCAIAQLAAFESDAEAVEAWAIEPFEYARIVRAAEGDELFLLCPPAILPR
ncbi:MAG: hypothetical protein Q8K32_04880 [Archangium sp.]|nr:hypothetical protein [Archangium sp.]